MSSAQRPHRHPIVLAVVSSCAVAALLVQRRRRRAHRIEWHKQEQELQEQEEAQQKDNEDPSIVRHFRDLRLDDSNTISEANQKRSARYYELARDAHICDLVPGVRSYPRLRMARDAVYAALMKYHKSKKSHRTVLAMCDGPTQRILTAARTLILAPLNYSVSVATEQAWIPAVSIIPSTDMHVTIALPWWWHTVRPGNAELSRELLARLRQAVALHHEFQIELDRIVLLGGQTLVALWRTVGEREISMIVDRHGTQIDPFVKLRRDIVRCFTSTEQFGHLTKEPLTYSHRFQSGGRTEQATLPQDSPPKRPPCPQEPPERQNTIELKTPGMGGGDGFIHTTLARLPIDCLSMRDVELAPIHRLCREATATYSGHRLPIRQFRFVETTGAGGASNPCVEPIFDETIDAAPRVRVALDGAIHPSLDAPAETRHATIGALPAMVTRPSIDGLFAPSSSLESVS